MQDKDKNIELYSAMQADFIIALNIYVIFDMRYRLNNLLLSTTVPKNDAINDDNSNRMQRAILSRIPVTSRYITSIIRIRKANKDRMAIGRHNTRDRVKRPNRG